MRMFLDSPSLRTFWCGRMECITTSSRRLTMMHHTSGIVSFRTRALPQKFWTRRRTFDLLLRDEEGQAQKHAERSTPKQNASNSQGGVVVSLAGAHVDRVFGNLSRNVKTVGCVLDVICVDARTRRRTRPAAVVKRQRLLDLGLRLHNQLLKHFLSNMRQSEVGAPLQSAPARVRQGIACEAHTKRALLTVMACCLPFLVRNERTRRLLMRVAGRRRWPRPRD